MRFVVDGSPRVHEAAIACRAERWMHPLLRVHHHDVCMAHDQERPLPAVAFQACDQVDAVRFGLEALNLDSLFGQHLLQIVDHRLLVAGRVAAVHAQHRLVVLQGFLLQPRPVGIAPCLGAGDGCEQSGQRRSKRRRYQEPHRTAGGAQGHFGRLVVEGRIIEPLALAAGLLTEGQARPAAFARSTSAPNTDGAVCCRRYADEQPMRGLVRAFVRDVAGCQILAGHVGMNQRPWCARRLVPVHVLERRHRCHRLSPPAPVALNDDERRSRRCGARNRVESILPAGRGEGLHHDPSRPFSERLVHPVDTGELRRSNPCGRRTGRSPPYCAGSASASGLPGESRPLKARDRAGSPLPCWNALLRATAELLSRDR